MIKPKWRARKATACRAIALTTCTLLTSIFFHSNLFSCTDFTLTAKDGAIINGRSMEFGIPINSQIYVHPRGESRTSTAPNSKQGISWKSKYGIIGANALGMDIIIDGFNEKGLSVGALWFPSAKYQDVLPKEASYALAIEDFGLWALGNFATVAEVKDALKSVRIWGHSLPQLGGEPPLHLSLHDAKGHNLVIEFIQGKVMVYDNPDGTLTNYPGFDWHRINLQNYINLTAIDKGSINYRGTILGQTGHGSGLLGIPGDWTPPSRFVRITLFKQFAMIPENAPSGVNLAAHLLNTVDIPQGDIRSKANSSEGDYTQWIVIKDLTNKIFYYRSYKDLTLRGIDLSKVNLGINAPKQMISMGIGQPVSDVTSELHEVMPAISKAREPQQQSSKYLLSNE